MTYCDYKIHENDKIEVDIFLTIEQYRGHGLANLLLNFITASYPNQEIIIGTSESNIGNDCVYWKVRFKEEYRTLNNRVNGDAPIHYRYFSN